MHKVRWYLRQTIPTKFATAYRDLGTEAEPKDVPTFCEWWMWLGKCFHVSYTEI